MSSASDLEERLRRGLAEAAAQVPPARPLPPTVAGTSGDGADAVVPLRSPRVVTPRVRFLAGLAYTAAALILVLSAVITLQQDGVSDNETEAGWTSSDAVEADTTTTEPPRPHQPEPANGMRAGQAVVVGSELRTYAADGTPTGTVSLAVFDEGVSTVSSDLDGGWVACGMLTNPDWTPGSSELVRLSRLMWFPRDGAPRELASESHTLCTADALQVIDTAAGPTVVYRRDGFAAGAGGGFQLGAIVLATGEDRLLPITPSDPGGPSGAGIVEWSAATGTVVTWDEAAGLQLWDVLTGQPVAVLPLDVTRVGDLALAPDARTVAVLDAGSGWLSVHDLASGEVRLDVGVRVVAPGAHVSYDGTDVAVSNPNFEGLDIVEIFDVENGTSRTIDGAGLLP